MKTNVIFVAIMLCAVHDHWCLKTIVSVILLHLYLMWYVCLPFWSVCLFSIFLFSFVSMCFCMCVCFGFLFDFGFWLGSLFPSKRKWNEDKIHVSFRKFKFHKLRKSKSVGAYYFWSSQEKRMRGRCLCCISSVSSECTKVYHFGLQRTINVYNQNFICEC